ADTRHRHPRAVKERGRDETTACLLGDGNPGLLEHRGLEIAAHETGESLGWARGRGARSDCGAWHRALEHLKSGVRGAIAVVERDELSGELLRRVDAGGRRDAQGPADDHASPSDLSRADRAFRHPAVIAALSGLEHLRFAASHELALVRGGLV